MQQATKLLDHDASQVVKQNVGLLEALKEVLEPEGVERIFTSQAMAGKRRALTSF